MSEGCASCQDGSGRIGFIIPGHPFGRFFEQCRSILQQSDQIIKGINQHQIAGMDQAHEHVPDIGPMLSSVKQRVLPMLDTSFQALLTDVIIQWGSQTPSKIVSAFPSALSFMVMLKIR